MRCKRLFVVVAGALFCTFLAGCGGSSNNPTPQGGFTNANLNGTFAMSFSGTDANGFFAVASMITVDGNGHITSGVLDINEAPTPITNASVTGTYVVRADGRGVMGLTGPAGNFNLVFVIVANNRALVTRFEQSAVGSGSLDLVNSSAFSTAALAGTFVFNLSGIDIAQNSLATVGSITTNSTGTVTSGVQDQSDNGAILTNNPITSGSIQVASNGRGTASITTAAGPQNFAFYVVDANHIKLVETDSLPALAGDAFRQSGTISAASLTGPFAFTVAGNDVAAGPFAAGGVFSSNGSGTITSGIEDFNDAGSPIQNVALAGTYSIDPSGRGTATITTATVGTLTFAFYPTTNGVQLIETDTGLVVSGAAFPQTGALSTATLQGAYGLNYTAATLNGELDTVASINANGTGHLTGIMDANNVGSTSTGTALNGNYTIDATGHGPLTLTSGLGQQNMAIYAISNTRALFVELDTDIVAAGSVEHQ
ncbi:MAG TPA: hypothetical protein VJV96_03335 [Candidatus Angelobacter sp.]|nr:hypothetical protein [Candidatus Angelobacter sp.]